MTDRARRNRATAIALCALALTGCAAAPDPLAPSTEADRIAVFEQRQDVLWADIAERYPSAERPDLAVRDLVADDEWIDTLESCIAEFGFAVDLDDGESDITYEQRDAEQLDVARFACESRYPRARDIRSLLGPYELRRYWLYFDQVQAPCLERQGYAIPPTPTFTDFVRDVYTPDAWLPYRFVQQPANLLEPVALDRLYDACPPDPPSLDPPSP